MAKGKSLSVACCGEFCMKASGLRPYRREKEGAQSSSQPAEKSRRRSPRSADVQERNYEGKKKGLPLILPFFY